MSTATRWFWATSALVTLLVGPLQPAEGGGIQVPDQGARATGQGSAFTAQADDPSAIYYNPAGLTQLTGTQMMAGMYAIFPDFEFDGAAGHAGTNEPAYPPHFYMATDLGLKDWRFGLGVNNVFGITEDWGSNSPLRTIVTHADLAVINIAPTVAYRVNEHLSFGAGLNIYYGDLELNNKLPLPAQPEGAIRVEGTDTTVGATAGVLWRINPHHAVGAVYRSPFTLDFEGSSKIYRSGLEPIGPSTTTASADFPQIITVGYAFYPIEKLKLEADVQWADWDTLNDVPLHSRDPRFSSLPARRFDYESSFTYRLGVQYQLDRHWTVRAGYVYAESASPEGTFTPVIVDLNSHSITAGLGYSERHWGVDVAYRYLLSMDRSVDNSINSPPGDYSESIQAVMVSLTLKF